MAKRNQQIGTCPCIAKGCDLVAQVFKFETRAGDDTRRRFGGKLYGQCADGHVFGTRGESQEYITENAEIWGAKKPAAAAAKPAVAPVAAPVQKPVKQAPAPVPAPETQQRKPAQGFGFFR